MASTGLEACLRVTSIGFTLALVLSWCLELLDAAAEEGGLLEAVDALPLTEAAVADMLYGIMGEGG